ncbi:lysophospholipid acyltransferase family protein [Marinigracilibium pacificum]|uniref:1-acyl-sn-glycerol-3-phosphate acyltransferase n=1 Tax=Marinigracilibium pacificum TaxID=2729599 RepID=A0A848J2M1_9BACT|nr:lysophospholipid acyltransferase family protein [Marinigracilibium pacificum]NMM48790.1 1-acyl-sn-glycerol-3-phosphate acyltransferase [Marinigracilibium pacificum]
MKNFLKWIYTIYAAITFVLVFLCIYPFFLIMIFIKPLQGYLHFINHMWARTWFTIVGMPVKVVYEKKFSSKKQVIFVANHFSYMDIALMTWLFNNFIFMGKSSIARVPLFGYMFRKLHITVDRSRAKDRYAAYRKGLEKIKEGKSLAIFPEGGIKAKNPPQMAMFKDGAFRLAIEQNVALVPVTLPYNWLVLPDDQFLLSWHSQKMIVHEPIETHDLTEKDIPELKKRVYSIIQNKLDEHFPAYAIESETVNA